MALKKFAYLKKNIILYNTNDASIDDSPGRTLTAVDFTRLRPDGEPV